MIRSGNWTTIERLPEIPGVAKMTGNGFWLDGKFYPTAKAMEARRAATGTGAVYDSAAPQGVCQKGFS